MKKPLFTILFLASIASAVSQNNDYIRARYQLTYKPSKTYKNLTRKEDMLLFIDQESSTFVSFGKYAMDSVFSLKDKGQLIFATQKPLRTSFREVITKNYQSNKIIVTDKTILEDRLKYKEDLNLFQWAIDLEKKIINNYPCQKATTHFAGRDYIAWFSSEIPISDGPYKFNGLPGLIIEIYDTDDHYHYVLMSFKRSKMPHLIFTENKKDYFDVDKQEFFRIKNESYTYKRIRQDLEVKGIKIGKEIKNMIDQDIKNSDNPIELIEF